jgi:HK97 family phage prohead protease
LRLSEDSAGLQFELSIPDTTAGRDVLALAERGDLGGMSFGFLIPDGGDKWTGRQRELLNIDLREISVVSAWPAYPETTVTARSKTPRLNLAKAFLETCR